MPHGRLTVCFVWLLKSKTHFFGRLMREASWHLTVLMGIPVSLVFVAIIAEYFINASPPREDADDDEGLD